MPRFRFFAALAGLTTLAFAQPDKPLITLDEFFDSVSINDVQISPDGKSVAIEIEKPDWDGNRFSREIWLWRDGDANAHRLTQSGFDHSPRWSPDGRWVAFLSERPRPEAGKADTAKDSKDKDKDKGKAQVWGIAVAGGEAFPVTGGDEEVHAFTWSSDSRGVFYATRTPWTKSQDEAYSKEWNDVIRFRESERGDVVFRIDAGPGASGEKALPQQLESTEYRVSSLTASPDGSLLAFATESRSERQESVDPYRIYVIDLKDRHQRLLSHTQAVYENLQWSPDGTRIFFTVENGSVEGKYRDVQSRLYSVKTDDGSIEHWASRFEGAVSGYAVSLDGALIAGMRGTSTGIYGQANPSSAAGHIDGWPGSYAHLSTARSSARVAFAYSALQRPVEVYLAETASGLNQARPITSFNKLFAERSLPQGRPYQWKSDDGRTVEGMLVYPPGKFGGKRLRMLTLIHGGPLDADGDRFGADWYDWAILAAERGWLVFRPNYRGSSGYGDAFALEIVPKQVSRPGLDILEGVDALVKDGIADPDRLTIGGYSYGGYMTNWLITQTNRFKAAVTGAGAVENVTNWGNDDETFDDAYYLGGNPWEARQNYNDEAAIWQIGKVATPTHIVAGAEDVRVHFTEAYLLERALQSRGVPSSLLVFPGEGHPLGNNPWHGKIKVREELKWLEKYAGN